MRGKMMRIGLVLLVAALLMTSFAGCGKNNPSVLKLPDTTAAPETQIQETPAPLTPLGDRICYVGKETISESTLFSFVLTEETFDPMMGLTLKLKSTNKSNTRDFVVSLNYLSVNGYMQDSGYEAQVPAGQTVLGEILIPANALRTSGVSSVEELILYPLIYDPNVSMGQGDVVDGAFSFYPTGQTKGTVVYPVRQKTTAEQTFFDNGFGTMIVLGADLNDSGDLEVNCYLENKTDRFLSFGWSDVTVNGTPVNTTADSVVAPGMRRYMTVPLSGIPENPSELALKVSATPLSSTGTDLSPLLEQRGTYRFAVAGSTGTGAGDTDADGDGDGDGDYEVVAATPAGTATPAPTTIVYTSPTNAQKKNAKKGYVNADKVNMRSGPGTSYKTVGKKIAQNTTATLYELQDGWWFLKCDGHYGYIKSNYVSQGKPKATAVPEAAEGDGKSVEGTVTTKSIAALRKEADRDSKCLKELSNGAKVTVHYKTKGKDGESWYYVSYGKTKGYIRASLVKPGGKVPNK